MRQSEDTRLNYGDHALIITPAGDTFLVEAWLNCQDGNTDLNPAFKRVMLSEHQHVLDAIRAGEHYLKQAGLLPNEGVEPLAAWDDEGGLTS